MSDSSDTLISVENVSKKFCKDLQKSLWYGLKDITKEFIFSKAEKDAPQLRKEEFWALRDVSFHLKCGESLAVIGANGAGKSTLLKLLSGLIRPDTGKIIIKGRISAIIELGAGLDPNLTGRENIFLKAALFDIDKKNLKNLVDKIIEFAELREFIDTPVQFYSSGMNSRLSFAVTAFLAPDILLIDEVLAVGDMNFQRKCVNHTLKYLSNGGSLILVSHNPSHIHSICKKGVLLEKGKVAFQGTAIETLETYLENQNKAALIAIDSSEQNDQNNPTKIKEVQIKSLNDEYINSGDDIFIQVSIFSAEDFENITWGFSVFSGDGQICITNNFRRNSILKKGLNTFSCTIPEFPLVSGSYLLKIIFVERSSIQPLAIKGWYDAPVQFSVQAKTHISKNVALASKQLINLNVKWN